MQLIKIKMADGCDDLIPSKAHNDDAGYDLRSSIDMILPVRQSIAIPTGVYLELPVGYEAQVRPRSGLALKHSIMLTNSPGTIDAGFRGELKIIAYNGADTPFVVKRGDKMAQMVIAKLAEVELSLTDSISESQRGEGGFGSTGR